VIDLMCKRPTGLLIMLEEKAKLKRQPDNNALLTQYHNTHLNKADCYAKPRYAALRHKNRPPETTVMYRKTTRVRLSTHTRGSRISHLLTHDNHFHSAPSTRFASDEFIVCHFAGEVSYSVGGFIQKNNDSLHEDLLSVWLGSEVPFFRNLFTDSPERDTPGFIAPVRAKINPSLDLEGKPVATPPRRKDPLDRNRAAASRLNRERTGPGQISGTITVSGVFRQQLEELTATLRATEPHYIK
jgi:myosin heavy subunit